MSDVIDSEHQDEAPALRALEPDEAEMLQEAEAEAQAETEAQISITIVFYNDLRMQVVGRNTTLGHFWAAAGYLNRLADQTAEESRMAQLAEAARAAAAKPGGLFVPSDHLGPGGRRRNA